MVPPRALQIESIRRWSSRLSPIAQHGGWLPPFRRFGQQAFEKGTQSLPVPGTYTSHGKPTNSLVAESRRCISQLYVAMPKSALCSPLTDLSDFDVRCVRPIPPLQFVAEPAHSDQGRCEYSERRLADGQCHCLLGRVGTRTMPYNRSQSLGSPFVCHAGTLSENILHTTAVLTSSFFAQACLSC